ncbi:hypothetical protein [Bacillus sp. AFS041924]|uniref:hypothetical protein n=1 Tax=Bacillus sp. AFS041924 TaxID=2033503 RepID=UPI000BFE535C|nr:hypothetical protein [Bacillus sp. AFS041924]PGS48283.1 hypothetical protein COC46_18460 [Bacillus sp. AFS041924]
MSLFFSFIGIYLMPIICIVFILSIIGIVKLVIKGKEVRTELTVIVVITFTLMVYTPIYLLVNSL